MTGRPLAVACVGFSAALHAWLASGLSEHSERRVAVRRDPPIELLLAAPVRPVTAPDPPPMRKVEPPPQAPKPRPQQVPPREPVAAEPAASEPIAAEPAAPEPVAAEPPASELGSTLAGLTGADGAWALSHGNVRLSPRSSPAGARIAAAARSGSEPEAVPLARLGQRPVPPSLEGALRRHYPESARSQGRSGESKVRARIEASGQVSSARVTSESAVGFGAACQRALLESRWTAPLDERGRAVATWVTYRCKFRVAP